MKNTCYFTISFLFIVNFFNLHAQTSTFLSNYQQNNVHQNLSDLPWSKIEISQAAKIFSGKIFFEDQASEKNFKTYSPQAAIVHLATHAEINDTAALYSKFIFTENKDSTEDNLLYTYELYNMKLNSELAILSACNTGTGKLVHGEGIMSLARGFRYAGCRNIMMSLWQVDDKATSLIIEYFFQNIAKGMGKSEALQSAKLQYLNNAHPAKAAPYYWAGLILIGDNEPLKLPKNKNSLPLFLFLTAIFLIFVILFKIFFPKLKNVKNILPALMLLFMLVVVSLEFCNFNCEAKKPIVFARESKNMDANSLIDLAEKYYFDAYYDSSKICFSNAALLSFYQQNWSAYLSCLNGIAKNFLQQTEFDSANFYLRHALTTVQSKDSNNFHILSQIHNNLGTLARKQTDFEKALYYYQQAQSFAEKLSGNREIILADIFQNSAITYYLMANFTQADKFVKKSFSLRQKISGDDNPEIAHNYNLSGLIFEQAGEFEQALNNYTKSLEIRKKHLRWNHPDLAQSYNNIGVIYYQKGDYSQAIKFYRQALDINQNIFAKKNFSIAGGYLNLGVVSDKKGDYEKALEYYFEALSILDNIGETNHAMKGDIYNNIGIAFKNLDQNDLALEYYQKALSIYKIIFGEIHPNVANVYLNLGVLFSNKKNHYQSIANFKKALFLGNKIFGNKHPHNAIIYLNMGNEFIRIKNYAQAQKSLKKSSSLCRKIYGEKHPILAEAYQLLGSIALRQAKIQQALLYFQKSISATVLDFDNADIYSNPKLANINDEMRLLSALSLKAQTLEKLFATTDTDISVLKHAVETFELATDLIDRIINNYSTDHAKLLMREKTHEIFTGGALAAYKLYTYTDNDNYKNLVFQFSEKSKSTLLRQTLLDNAAKNYAGIPDSLLYFENQLKIDISFYQKKLIEIKNTKQAADSIKISHWKNRLFSLNRQYERLIKKFETDYTEYFSLKYQSEKIDPKFIQENYMDSDAVLVEYLICNSSVFIFTLSQQNFDVTQVLNDSLFFPAVVRLRDGLINREFSQYLKNANTIYQTLIKPIEAKLSDKNLIIIPDGILGYIPFEILLSQKTMTDKPDPAGLPYLIKTHAISYNYSASLISADNKSKKFPKYQFTGFAPVKFN